MHAKKYKQTQTIPQNRKQSTDQPAESPQRIPLWAQAPVVQTKSLRINRPGDRYEQEADRVADQVMRMPHTAIQRQVEAEEDEEPLLQRNATDSALSSIVSPELSTQVQSMQGGGQPLDVSTRAFMESRLGHDFGDVRVHTDNQAAETAQQVNARAYTVGRDIVFGRGQYRPQAMSGQHLLAHELTHVIQQTGGSAVLQRQEKDEEATEKPKINYAKAKRQNKRLAKRLGWGSRLATIQPTWHKLWDSGNVDGFADKVAAFQKSQGFKRRQIDGILGPRTWDQLRPVGEVVAKQSVSWQASETICYEASRERMQRGFQRATGERLIESGEWRNYKIILRSNPGELKKAKIAKKYWGASAAGALVYLGNGTFVDKSAIWDKKALKPGAVLQVWIKQTDLDRIKAGKMPISIGTSAVFVKYIGNNKMKVRHFKRNEIWSKSRYEVWIGANWTQRK